VEAAKKNVAVLATCQALLFTNNSTVIAINGLAGFALAPDKSLATLPVTLWVIGGACTSFLASMLMKRIGRRDGFTVGALLGILGAAIASTALYLQNFWLLLCGTFVFGAYNAFGQYYRFAAADAAPGDFKAKAISLVLAGGLVGGLIGPNTSRFTVDLFSTRFLGAYLSLIGFLVLVIAVLRLLRIPPPSAAESKEPPRPLAVIMRQPAFVVAVIASALSYGIMNLLMTATPLEMTAVCGHPYSAAAMVISSHVVGMFAPSFFTGSLIKRFGHLNVMFAGVLINFACIGIALSGITIAHFWWALVLLGVGWNFLYIGSTALLTETYRPSEKAKAQGANDSLVFLAMVTSSFSSGYLLNSNGWWMLNVVSAGAMAVVAGALLFLMLRPALRASAAS
jgi:MFS family permease